MNDNTSIYTLEDIKDQEIKITLKEVYLALEEKGYNPVNQMIGYLMSGDPGYISSHKDARKKINSIGREKILESLINKYLKK